VYIFLFAGGFYLHLKSFRNKAGRFLFGLGFVMNEFCWSVPSRKGCRRQYSHGIKVECILNVS
jgi:hypothetical protein